MRKPEPNRFVKNTKPRVDTLDMKGFSESRLILLPASEPQQKLDKPLSERTSERSDKRTDERTNERQPPRIKTRHAFDIYQDQLRSLQKIQLEAVQAEERKPHLGEMVRVALDRYLEKRENDAYDRTNERSNQRTDE